MNIAKTSQFLSPNSGSGYYDSATRARAHYVYDGGGRMTGTYNWWDTYGGSSYSSSFIRGNECVYELTGSKRGLKTHSKYLIPVSGSPSTWSVQRDETYSYDSDIDHLSGADYDDGLANETVTWGYDAAGNRASDSSNSGTWTYDNLNRMTASPGASYTNDILGNRTSKGSTTYTWDILNRMTGVGSYSYVYRADGMRVSKSSSAGSTAYRYDGQMGTEDVERNSSGTITALTRYGNGARGSDVISRTTSSGNTLTYPLYDSQGNSVGQLSKNGSAFNISDERSYDAWGGVRSGGATGDNKGRYVANLGHRQDDESGLIYMRARYLEPTSGRFISEDPDMTGYNWTVYCNNDPVNFTDKSGCSEDPSEKNLSFIKNFFDLTVDMFGETYKRLGNVVLKVIGIFTVAKALCEQLDAWAIGLQRVAVTSQNSVGVFAFFGMEGLAAVAQSVSGLARFCAAGLKLAKLFVTFAAVVSALIAFINGGDDD